MLKVIERRPLEEKLLTEKERVSPEELHTLKDLRKLLIRM